MHRPGSGWRVILVPWFFDRLVLVGQNSPGFLVEIIVLPVPDRPQQQAYRYCTKNQCNGNEQIQAAHKPDTGLAAFLLSRRREFNTTSSELADIPIAASQGGTHPIAASGIALRL